jgi:hypothetical protein
MCTFCNSGSILFSENLLLLFHDQAQSSRLLFESLLESGQYGSWYFWNKCRCDDSLIFLLNNLACHHQPQAYNQTFSHFLSFFSDLMVTSGGLQ